MVAANHGLFAACCPSALMPLKQFSLLPLGRGLSSLVAPILAGGMRNSTISSSARDPKKTSAKPHHKKPPPESILGRFLHLKRQNPSKGLDEGDRRQRSDRRRAVLSIGGGFHPARAIQKIQIQRAQ